MISNVALQEHRSRRQHSAAPVSPADTGDTGAFDALLGAAVR